jgi:hypothetical protein
MQDDKEFHNEKRDGMYANVYVLSCADIVLSKGDLQVNSLMFC